MHRIRSPRFLGAILAYLLLAVTPFTALAARAPGAGQRHAGACPSGHHHVPRVATSSGQTVMAFGREHGNIRPFTVTIDDTGAVTENGPMMVHNHQLSSATNTLNGLLKLADVEGFFTMSTSTQCTGALPDIAAQWISIHANSGTRKVSVHGGCSAAFNQLYGVLEAAVGLTP